ncbi:TIGR03084 family metal-binding protein [Mycolicibacterium septicum]|uniref:TIGR03084 family metal-binding protein n=1 Tax=Mycolicibacterium septicum TaxID=98668 RepID=UPI00235EABBC|nr:TIGR03084 family metal-binding protein [Mycolicibacterium septicum]
MAVDYPALLDDLRQETDNLLEQLRTLAAAQWDLPTPAARWSIKDQITHLAFFDDATLLAINHPEEFRVQADAHIAGGMDFPDRITDEHRHLSGERVCNWFTDSRQQLIGTFIAGDPKRRLPWYGPDMSMASSATARLMETWAHGQDIYDTLGLAHPPSPGLRSIAHLGVATFAFTHQLHGRDVPAEPVRVELTAPDGELWTWGPADAPDRVSGPAEDFVLAATQRRHWTETYLTATGSVATGWLDIVQAFAGAPSRREPKALR